MKDLKKMDEARKVGQPGNFGILTCPALYSTCSLLLSFLFFHCTMAYYFLFSPQSYEKAVQLDSDHANAHMNLGVIFHLQVSQLSLQQW